VVRLQKPRQKPSASRAQRSVRTDIFKDSTKQPFKIIGGASLINGGSVALTGELQDISNAMYAIISAM
jgi:hypothetical protein